ncbi:MAG: Coenzyme F420 hydrogenase/dehydrogenase, beta subunit C-terminal domain [Rikenellaceae bacterium]|nr:Coenzyme F420 hydrogenase/dehydrogenase, beta subunit C-terminal domain [Rikenellaceae bacterium]
MIVITDKEKCSGCAACLNICPCNAISMKPDAEGFDYPAVATDLCVECGLCLKVCPLLHERKIEERTRAFVVQHSDERTRLESSSGGAFSAIGEWVTAQGGVVYGAAFTPRFNVVHAATDKPEELGKFRGSKYVQSEIGHTFRAVKAHLNEGRMVCFSGTPCQVEGLVRYLGKPYERLITVDLVCHGIPSPKIWRKYLDFQEHRYGKIEQIGFRDKRYGYAGSTMAIRYASGRQSFHGRELQFFKDTFFRDLSTRPACYNCHFKTVERLADITLYDCWHTARFDKALDDDKGSTFLLTHTPKGERVVEGIKPYIRYCETPTAEAIATDGKMAVTCIARNPRRTEFFADADRLTVPELMHKYLPVTFKRRMTLLLKPLLYRTGLLKVLKRLM